MNVIIIIIHASQLVPNTNSYQVNSYPSQQPVQVNSSTPKLQSVLEIYLKAITVVLKH